MSRAEAKLLAHLLRGRAASKRWASCGKSSSCSVSMCRMIELARHAQPRVPFDGSGAAARELVEEALDQLVLDEALVGALARRRPPGPRGRGRRRFPPRARESPSTAQPREELDGCARRLRRATPRAPRGPSRGPCGADRGCPSANGPADCIGSCLLSSACAPRPRSRPSGRRPSRPCRRLRRCCTGAEEEGRADDDCDQCFHC